MQVAAQDAADARALLERQRQEANADNIADVAPAYTIRRPAGRGC